MCLLKAPAVSSKAWFVPKCVNFSLCTIVLSIREHIIDSCIDLPKHSYIGKRKQCVSKTSTYYAIYKAQFCKKIKCH
jgi:hypothetical protein